MAEQVRSPSYRGRGFSGSPRRHRTAARMRFLWVGVSGYLATLAIRPRYGLPGLINTEGPDAVITQCGIFDWPALLSHAGAAKSSIGAEEVVVRLALPHVLCRGLVPFSVRVRLIQDRSRLYGRGRQGYQSHEGWNDRAHLSLFLGGNSEAVCWGDD
jgi:hypothetical protein